MTGTLQKYVLLVLLALLSAGAFAQISAVSPDFTDSTKYRTALQSDTTHYKRESRTQDKIYVYYKRLGKLEARQPKGYPVHFTWYKLDTANLTFSKIWADSASITEVPAGTSFSQLSRDSSRCAHALPEQQFTYTSESKTSALPDSLSYGCYRVVTDTLQAVYDTLRCDTFCYDKFLRYDTIRSFDGARDSLFVEVRDTLYVDTTLYIPKAYRMVAADTFNAWIFIDTFLIDSIVVGNQDCNYLPLQILFYPNHADPEKRYPYYAYRYLDLWQAPMRVERNCPDFYGAECGGNYYCYLQKVKWTTSVDIHKGVDKEFDEEWKKSFTPSVPSPYYNAEYEVVVTNYFGQADTMSTGIIEAMATLAKMKLFVKEDDTQNWVEKTDESGEESPAAVKLENVSINSNHGDSALWSLFSNLYEQPEDVLPEDVPLIMQVVTTDSAATLYPTDYNPTLYEPGKYPIALYVTNRHGCFSSDTIYFEVEEFLINKEAIPTVLTPNGDDKNDAFKLKDPDQNVKSLQSLEVNIFNRYGQLVFRSGDVLFSWDGKLRNTNAPAPDGVYFYILKASGLNKKRETVRQTYRGNIHLFNGQ
jgi:gliding motility-associated-like protein